MSAGTDPCSDPGTDREVAFLDLFDRAFQPDTPEVHTARETCWYARTPLGYAILRYEEVAALLRDRRLRQGGVETLAAQGITAGPFADWMRMIMLNLEGEQHARLRRRKAPHGEAHRRAPPCLRRDEPLQREGLVRERAGRRTATPHELHPRPTRRRRGGAPAHFSPREELQTRRRTPLGTGPEIITASAIISL